MYRSPGYLAQCEGILPAEKIYSHISGIDLVLGKDGNWYVLEDNLRIPSGTSYPLIARQLCRDCSPDTFRKHKVRDNRNYGRLLKETMGFVNRGGINVIFTPGRYNAAYFEHSYLAEQAGAVLAECEDLFVENDTLYYRSDEGAIRVGTLYRRVSDEYLDPLYFEPSSLIGIPNLMSAYRAGHVAVMNAPGNGVADDKGIYYMDGDKRVMRKADLRAFVLTGKDTVVWPSGLTRFSRIEGGMVVNSSQGGGFKDTWVISL